MTEATRRAQQPYGHPVRVPDRLRADGLTDTHLGRYVRVSGHTGTLRAVYVDKDYVQLLLDDGGPPLTPVVGAGAAVALLD
jgi:hypothetical protein